MKKLICTLLGLLLILSVFSQDEIKRKKDSYMFDKTIYTRDVIPFAGNNFNLGVDGRRFDSLHVKAIVVNDTLLPEYIEAYSSGTVGAAAGSDGNLQYNHLGSLGATGDLDWDNSTKSLSINGKYAQDINVTLSNGVSDVILSIEDSTVLTEDITSSTFKTSFKIVSVLDSNAYLGTGIRYYPFWYQSANYETIPYYYGTVHNNKNYGDITGQQYGSQELLYNWVVDDSVSVSNTTGFQVVNQVMNGTTGVFYAPTFKAGEVIGKVSVGEGTGKTYIDDYYGLVAESRQDDDVEHHITNAKAFYLHGNLQADNNYGIYEDYTYGENYFASKTTIDNTLKLNDYVRHDYTYTNSVNTNDTVSHLNYNILVDFETTSSLSSYVNLTNITIPENVGTKLGKRSVFGPSVFIVNTNDSVAGNIGGGNNFLDNYKGFVNNMTGVIYFTATNPDGVRAKTVIQNGGNFTTNVKPGSTEGSISIVDDITAINANMGLGKFGTTTIGTAESLDINTTLSTRSGSFLDIDTYKGIDFNIVSTNSGTITIDNMYGIYMTNPTALSGSVNNYGIYEAFGPNYFASETTVDNNLTVTDTVEVDVVITNSIQATGAEALKFYTYTYTVTSTDITNTYANVTITAVTLADVRNLDAIILDGGSSVKKTYNSSYIDYVDITTTTNVLIEWDSDVAEGDVISITIVEKD